MTDEQTEQILKELQIIRKLKLAEMLERGYSQSQLAQILGVSQPTISRMIPKVSGKRG
jgi:predicted transcriptional regulator